MNSPVRLGVSPTASTPTGFFSQRFWGFISPCWNPGLHDLSCSPVILPGLSTCKFGTACSTSRHLAWSTSYHLTHLWRWLGGDASMWSEAVHWMHWLSVLPGDEGQGQLMPEFCQGLLGINYKAFCGWLLFVLGFEVPNRAQVANQGELLLVLGLGPLSKRYEAC